jgi:hypothetical protein
LTPLAAPHEEFFCFAHLLMPGGGTRLVELPDPATGSHLFDTITLHPWFDSGPVYFFGFMMAIL